MLSRRRGSPRPARLPRHHETASPVNSLDRFPRSRSRRTNEITYKCWLSARRPLPYLESLSVSSHKVTGAFVTQLRFLHKTHQNQHALFGTHTLSVIATLRVSHDRRSSLSHHVEKESHVFGLDQASRTPSHSLAFGCPDSK